MRGHSKKYYPASKSSIEPPITSIKLSAASSVLSQRAHFPISPKVHSKREIGPKTAARQVPQMISIKRWAQRQFCLRKVYGYYNGQFTKLTMTNQKNKNLQLLHYFISGVSSRIGTENLALCLMTVANLLWPLSFLYVSQHHFSPFQTNLARGVAICASHIVLCILLGIDLDFKSSRDFKYLIIRSSLIGIHQFVYAGMYFVLSYPLINSIVITGPLFVFLIDYYLNGVTISRSQAIGIAVSFAGILININGDFIMSLIDPNFEIKSTYQNYHVTDIKMKIVFSLIAVMTNVLWGYAIVVQKKIKHVPGIKISYFLGIEFVLTSGISCSMGTVRPVEMDQFLGACVFSGLVMSFCQILFICALNLSRNSGKLTILMLLYGVSSYGISFFKFEESLNVICLVGLVMMALGLYRTIFTNTAA